MSLRPQVIRADTIDLQDPLAPSAQDHSNQPTHPSPRGFGPAAPHQDAELKHMAEERSEEEHHLSEIWNPGQINTQTNAELFMGPESFQNGKSVQPQSRLDNSVGPNSVDDGNFGDEIRDDQLDDGPVDDKMSSSPSIADEDIDFEFVYALHNFVATVEGQANANKGDTMVLLDDSNSYWWLVRLMRDSSIGYLPAEHIETPTERLARLNKHRNIDLSASMLGDNAEKSKNPLKKAMRRRNAKMVTFTTPTYYEPVAEWSDTEADDPDKIELEGGEGRRKGSQLDRDQAANGRNGAQSPQSVGQDSNGAVNGVARQDIRFVTDRESLENATLDNQDGISGRTRNVSSRSTDPSKDDSGGTRKMTLTPDLLRDDSSRSSMRSPEPGEKGLNGPDLFDQLGRLSPTSEKAGEDKKKKEKKPNMLSGLFKRKDKKIKVDEAAGSIVARQDENGATIYSPTSTGRASPSSGRSSPSNAAVPASSLRTSRSNSNSKLASISQTGLSSPLDNVPKPEPESLHSLQGRVATPEPHFGVGPEESTGQSTEPAFHQEVVPGVYADNSFQPTVPSVDGANASRSSVETSQRYLPEQPVPETYQSPTEIVTSLRAEDIERPITTETPALPDNAADVARYPPTSPYSGHPRLPENNSTMTGTSPDAPLPLTSTPAAASTVSSSVITAHPGPLASVTVEAEQPHQTPQLATTPTLTNREVRSTSTASTPTPSLLPRLPIDNARWDDAALHMYLERNASAVTKDMLIVVRDKTGVVPLPKDHPTMLEFGFHEQQKQLDDLSRQLDALMVEFMERKRKVARARSAA